MRDEEIRAIDCMTQHIKTFLKQVNNNELANFSEPCERCPYVKQCNLDWQGIMLPLIKETNIANPFIMKYKGSSADTYTETGKEDLAENIAAEIAKKAGGKYWPAF